jgi:hypothetical protein
VKSKNINILSFRATKTNPQGAVDEFKTWMNLFLDPTWLEACLLSIINDKVWRLCGASEVALADGRVSPLSYFTRQPYIHNNDLHLHGRLRSRCWLVLSRLSA